MRLTRETAARIVVALIVLVAVWSHVRYLKKGLQDFPYASPDDTTIHNARFAALRQARLDGKITGVVGFVAEPSYEDRKRSTSYRRTQYALAPLLVEDSLDRELIVGDFPSGKPVLPEGCDFDLSETYPGQVYLFRRTGAAGMDNPNIGSSLIGAPPEYESCRSEPDSSRPPFLRRQESGGEAVRNTSWISACAGMTIRGFTCLTGRIFLNRNIGISDPVPVNKAGAAENR